MNTTHTHYRVCNLCEAMCGLEIETDGDRVLRVKGDTRDPFSRGSVCPKGALIHKVHEDPDRLNVPLRKKENGDWEEVSWEAAYEIAEQGINRIRREHGDNAVALYLGNPTVHNFGMMLHVSMLKNSLGTKNVFSPTSMDQLPHHFIGYHMFGHVLNMPIPDIRRTDYLMMFGANPIASNGSIMSGCGPLENLRGIRERGGKVVLFDPRATETSRVVDEHHFIRPGTDVVFLLGMLRLIQEKGWIRLGHLADHVAGLNELTGIADEFTPERVERITGVSAEVLVRLTREYVLRDRAMLYGRMGMSTQEHGGLCHWLTSVINILTHHLDREGGTMFPRPAVDIKRQRGWHAAEGRWHSRVRGLPEFDGELPVSVLAEEMLTEGEGQVRGLVTFAGNPVLSTPNGKRLEQALPKLSFMVCIDIYLGATTRHADLILPPPSHLEVDHYDLVFNHFAVANNAKFSPVTFPAREGQHFDWQIARELAGRFGKASGYKVPLPFRKLSPRQLLNLALLTGPYGKLRAPWRAGGLSLKTLMDSKHGISLGGLKPRIPEVLNTPDGKIQLAPPVLLAGLRELKRGLESGPPPREKNAFQLIGRRHVRTNNSWMLNVGGLVRGKGKCTVMMSPEDATALQLADGDRVKVSSRTGSIELPLEHAPMMSGVVSIPHGFGHNKPGVRLSVATRAEVAGVSVNDITDETRLDPLTGNAAFSGTWVSITRAEKTGD